MTLRPDDPLLARRIVRLEGEIDDVRANETMAKLLYLQFTDKTAPVLLEVHSPGGSVTAGLAIVDTMDFLSAPVRTHCPAFAHGMATVILAHGRPGERTALPGARVELSPLFGAAGGPAHAGELERLTRKLVDLLARDLGRDAVEVRAMFEAGCSFEAADAALLGFVDRVGPP